MSVPDAIHRHADRVDHCLRNVLRALHPFVAGTPTTYLRDGQPVVCLGPVPVERWRALEHALGNAEPWPLELLGPVIMLWRDSTDVGPTPQRAAWFTRGEHDPASFIAFAKAQARREGMRLFERNALPNAQVIYLRFRPPDAAKGRATWMPEGSVTDLDAVPVTVWFPADAPGGRPAA